MQKTINVGLLGMGTVGTGVVKILTKNSQDILQKVGIPVNIKKIMVRQLDKLRNVDTDAEFTTNIDDIINDKDIDIVVELMGGTDPAKEYILRALRAGKHVVTANKDVVAKFGQEILDVAEEYKADFLFEASVAGGIPIIRPLKQCLAANKISEI
ncbi:MAG: homoserine dehydrogenase, partial [Sporomusaceae bacterium]|nr:homoserine dehydrogenase [Sporomusaceae bacterium]